MKTRENPIPNIQRNFLSRVTVWSFWSDVTYAARRRFKSRHLTVLEKHPMLMEHVKPHHKVSNTF